MATVTMKKLTFWEKLDMIPGLCSVVLVALYAVVTGLWRSEKQPKTLTLHVGYAILRKATARFSPLQLQLVMPPTNKIYEIYAKKASRPVQSVELPYGVHGHWVGDKDAKNVLIWYHGGGFALPANMGYFRFFSRIIADMRKEGKPLAVFCPTYTLTPHAVYPTQIRQAVECLRYILDTTGREPGNVFLGGDSAGGNLVGAVLSHVAHPHRQIDKVSMSENLGGAVLVSPWTTLETDYPPDQIIDPQGDLITHAVGEPWGGSYLGTTKRDYYTDLSMAPADWYHDFKVNSILILGGEHEILLPAVKDLATKVKDGFSNVEFFVGKREGHVASIYNLYLGDKTETDTGRRMKVWLQELLN
ncbi:hypothetical protein AJ78_06710 [Emergomyces pasteurianus Ep9510]|uniref:Alpha/beta hydrolase fold-3 domain-containing protein n=1 Tax=Emergomyces pasteurianus Ep9510 TaxID=1447872 RepID=A0A1J9Q9Y7_9EURO|nr:hypothetical protein AJ78_06710 [Emergomyces pasteurianus Ep9510]